MITVKDLIEFLQTQPQDLPVAHQMYSEQTLLSTDAIKREMLCKPRPDGWIQRNRADKDLQEYLVFPGN